MEKQTILKQYFGYTKFRIGQEEMIDNILHGKDVLGIMPTGAGKSICYQVPALIFPGITIIISPLISLMKDQVQSLVASGVAAAYINSSLTYNQTLKVLEFASSGKYKIIYVAPERILTEGFLEFARNVNISMVTIDEAHCVSQWGQNFRPSYLNINKFINELSKKPVVSAFTATATREVKNDIIKLLELKEPFVRATGYNRENLYFEVQKPTDKYGALNKYLKKNHEKSGIIYCSTRKTVEEIYKKLLRDKYFATLYHAGLSDNERAKNQDDFLHDIKPIMVATNAFGMGIDKSNVSFVIHYNMPKNLENYYQEAGRAGRDGSNADCILLYGGQDVVINQFLIDKTENKNNLDPIVQEQVKEKDREKLKKMTYYCHSCECLREYILKYFGDQTPNYCSNCSCCNTNFEEIDILEHSKKIISCISRMNERFGIKLVIDTLRGSKVEKIVKYGLNKLSTYNIMAEVSEKRLREIINFLVLNGYIQITNSEYPVAKLTNKSRTILFSDVSLRMKVVKENENLPKEKKATKKSKSTIMVNSNKPINDELLKAFKELRQKLARKRKVPAYIIFSDSTLLDMCQKMPRSREEFLEVSGVGDVKLNDFGDDFLAIINQFELGDLKNILNN